MAASDLVKLSGHTVPHMLGVAFGFVFMAVLVGLVVTSVPKVPI